MKKTCINFAVMALIFSGATSCVTHEKMMREPNSKVEFTKNDFNLSEQVAGEGKDTKIFGIDFFRIGHSSDMGYVKADNGKYSWSDIPVIGNYLADESCNYALHDLMTKNPGFDVVFYPQYEKHVRRPILGIGFIYKKTTVVAKARLGKLK